MRKRSIRPRAHFIGIGGIGMSALAQWFLANGWRVSGSDIAEGPLSRELKRRGVVILAGHKKRHLSPAPALVVTSQAIEPGNPEYKAARQLRVPVLTYPEMIGQLTRNYATVAVAGSHGKSTTTALVSLILKGAKYDPTVIIGAKLKEFNGSNFRAGRSKWLVLEADEYRAAFLNYSPSFAAVTNVDREHLDYYRTLGRVKQAFLGFLSRVREGGGTVLNADDPVLRTLKPKIARIAKQRGFRVRWYSRADKDAAVLRRIIKVPGAHNLSNALAALRVSALCGVPRNRALKAIARYRGVWRRMEYRGTFERALLFDDYAHHPTEIKATLAAFREKYPRARIICVFQPHQAKRLKYLFKEFSRAFDDADALVLLPLYRVAGRDTADTRYSSEKLASALFKKRANVWYLPARRRGALARALSPLVRDRSAIVVMMGAGDIAEETDALLKT